MRATVDLRATFDYADEISYAETLLEVMDAVRERCHADILEVRRGDGDAHEGHVVASTVLAESRPDSRPTPTLPNPSVGIKSGRPTR